MSEGSACSRSSGDCGSCTDHETDRCPVNRTRMSDAEKANAQVTAGRRVVFIADCQLEDRIEARV